MCCLDRRLHRPTFIGVTLKRLLPPKRERPRLGATATPESSHALVPLLALDLINGFSRAVLRNPRANSPLSALRWWCESSLNLNLAAAAPSRHDGEVLRATKGWDKVHHHHTAAETKRQNHGQKILLVREDSWSLSRGWPPLPPAGGWIMILVLHLHQLLGERWLQESDLVFFSDSPGHHRPEGRINCVVHAVSTLKCRAMVRLGFPSILGVSINDGLHPPCQQLETQECSVCGFLQLMEGSIWSRPFLVLPLLQTRTTTWKHNTITDERALGPSVDRSSSKSRFKDPG